MVKSTLDDQRKSCNFSKKNRETLSKHARRSFKTKQKLNVNFFFFKCVFCQTSMHAVTLSPINTKCWFLIVVSISYKKQKHLDSISWSASLFSSHLGYGPTGFHSKTTSSVSALLSVLAVWLAA